MTTAGDPDERKGFSLRRWSARKREVTRANASHAATPAAATAQTTSAARVDQNDAATAQTTSAARVDPTDAPALAPTGMATAADHGAITRIDGAASVAAPGTHAPAAGASTRLLPELPALDALTIDSDYSGFMQPGVDEALKRGALKKLFSDPRFNIMDGLDVYIGDYSKPDPIEPELVRTLVQARYIFNPPATRVNADGFVEDVPEAELPQNLASDADGQAIADGGAVVATTNTATIATAENETIAAARIPASDIDGAAGVATGASSDAAPSEQPLKT